MPSICFYFQVHQPYRLRPYSFFDIGKSFDYEDEKKNREIMNKVADKCYIKTNQKMLDLIRRHEGKFKISYSISGVALEQFEKYRPDVLQSFKDLAATGCVEFLGETYSHSLSFIYSKTEFTRQVNKHSALIRKHFNQTPKVFRNTELIYNNELAWYIANMGYKAILCEGVDRLLGTRTPNHVYQPINVPGMKVLLKNYRLSDDIAFRFSDRGWKEWPLTVDRYCHWIHSVAGAGEIINLFMDYETFGEHQWESTGIFDFLDQLPAQVMVHPDFDFKTPSEIADTYPAREVYDAHNYISWADTERDLSAWQSNPMQYEALRRIYSVEHDIIQLGDQDLMRIWEKLQTSDHFYYMCTKFWNDGDVHKYFSPYDSPYDAYMYFMNVFSDLECRIRDRKNQRKMLLEAVSNIPVPVEKSPEVPVVFDFTRL